MSKGKKLKQQTKPLTEKALRYQMYLRNEQKQLLQKRFWCHKMDQ
jgi:hypothetical protein